MNRIFTLLLALLACTAHVSAQTTADTLRAGAAVSGDTLIAVDEQTLVERLAQLLRERRAQHRHNRETADFLRTQLLFNLLDARNTPAQPVVTVPTQSAKRKPRPPLPTLRSSTGGSLSRSMHDFPPSNSA